MKYFATIFFILSAGVGACIAQGAKDEWLRVITGDDSVIDVDKNSLVLKPGTIINARFRTSNVSPQPLRRPNLSYYQRIDSIDFLIPSGAYRLVKSTFTGADAEVVYDSISTNSDWKRPSGSAHRFYSAALQLAPFGSWKVVSYKYASGEGPSNDDPPEILSMVGSTVSLGTRNLMIGKSNCQAPNLDFGSVSDKNLERYGFKLRDAGIVSDSVTVVITACGSNKAFPPKTFIFLQTPGKATILWNGVFFEMERQPTLFSS